MIKIIKHLYIALAFLVFTFPVKAEEVTSSSSSKPIYHITFLTTENLPNLSLSLTSRASRILPEFFNTNQRTTQQEFKIAPYAGKITLEHTENKEYCKENKKMCWPKYIEIKKGVMKITDEKNKVEYYKDTKNLYTFLWQEAKDVK